MRDYYQFFFRSVGAWKSELITNPQLHPFEGLQLPRNSAYHILPDGSDSPTPNPNDPILKGWSKPISLLNVHQLAVLDGEPRKLAYDVVSEFNKFLTANNMQFRRMKSLEQVVPDDQALVAISYMAIPRAYYYAQTNYSEWHSYYNLMKTVFQKVEELANNSSRHQFLVFDAPELVPSLELLKYAERSAELERKIVKDFNTPGRRLVLELFKWLGAGYNQNSLFSLISLANLSKVNLILRHKGNFILINLGLLFSWRSAPKTEKEVWEFFGKEAGRGQMPLQYQRWLIRFFAVISKLETPSVDVEKLDAELKAAGEEIIDDASSVPSIANKAGAVTQVNDDMDEEMDDGLLDDRPSTPAEKIDFAITEELEKELERELAVLSRKNDKYGEDEEDIPVTEVAEISDIDAPTIYNAVTRKCDYLADQGVLSAAEYKRHIRLSESFKKIKIDGKPVEDLIKRDPISVALAEPKLIPDAAGVKDKRMLKSSISELNEEYQKRGMLADTVSCIMAIQKAAISVTEIEKDRIDTIMGSSDVYSVRLVPVEGEPSTIKIRVSACNDDGSFVANGTKYRLRRQKADVPIRKISPNEVVLSSYYGPKQFITRGARKNNSYEIWLAAQIRAIGLDENNQTITDLHVGNDFDHDFRCNYTYSVLARNFAGFNLKGFECSFNHKLREERFGAEAIKLYEGDKKHGRLIFGKSKDDQYLIFGTDGLVYIGADKTSRLVGSFEDYVGIEEFSPVERADMRIIDKNIPLGVILSYEMGLETMLKALRVKYDKFEGNIRMMSKSNTHYVLRFKDCCLVIYRDRGRLDMIIGGLMEYDDFLKTRTLREFNKKDIYLPLLESRKLTLRYLTEIDNLYDLFIDPITELNLKRMNEPTTFRGLLLRAVELLLIDWHPTEMDTEYQQLKGNERMAGAIYRELVRSVRRHRSRSDRARAPIELKPHAVWKAIADDSAKLLMDEINPIAHLKEIEAVTFSGTGGRTAETMMAKSRIYTKKDMGIISEANVDSGDVGVNIWTSANPNLTTIYGNTKQLDGDYDPTKLFSTTTLLAPFAENEDMKRAVFTGIQNQHTVACHGYKPPQVRTGYEYVIPHRVGDLFCTTAKQAGVVESVTDDGIVVKYADGTVKGVQLGRVYGISCGSVVSHSLVSEMKPGQKFKEGDVIAYNSNFFAKDYFDPTKVMLKFNTTAKIALYEAALTNDDSSMISVELSERLRCDTPHDRMVVVSFQDHLSKVVGVGTEVEPDDILCYISPSVASSATGITDQVALDALTEWSNQTPTAKYKGRIEYIECFYHGDLENMSETVRKLAEASDRQRKQKQKAAAMPIYSSMVDDSFRKDGEAIPVDSMVIKFYIASSEPAAVADKVVYGNQLKSVIGEVISGEIVTESGVQIEAVFGQASIDNRIIDSFPRIGALTTLLKLIATKTVSAYRNQ